MNTNRHEYFFEPRNTRNNTETDMFFPCILCVLWLRTDFAFGGYGSGFGGGVWLKEIQQ